MNTFTLKTFSLAIMLSMILAACSPSVSLSMAESNKRREANPTVAQGDVTTLVDGNNAFALDLYNSLRSENGNLILSPYSISLALAMTYAGAHGETESQMAQTMHFPSRNNYIRHLMHLTLRWKKTP